MPYQEAVAEARRLVKRSEEDQWRLAELTWQQLQAGYTQQQWADDIGMPRRTVRRYAAIWERFRASMARPTFSEAIVEVDPGTRISPERARQTMQQMPAEQRAEVARELLQDQLVARQVVRDPRISAVVSDAQARERVEREQRVERVVQEFSPGAREHEKFLTARHLVHNARSNVALSLDAAREANLTAQRRRDLESDLADLEAAIGLYRSMLAGEAGFETELAELLEDGR